jgi:hypothetical protein
MCKWLTIAALLIGLVGTGLLKNSTSVLAASSDVGYRDFSYSTHQRPSRSHDHPHRMVRVLGTKNPASSAKSGQTLTHLSSYDRSER